MYGSVVCVASNLFLWVDAIFLFVFFSKQQINYSYSIVFRSRPIFVSSVRNEMHHSVRLFNSSCVRVFVSQTRKRNVFIKCKTLESSSFQETSCLCSIYAPIAMEMHLNQHIEDGWFSLLFHFMRNELKRNKYSFNSQHWTKILPFFSLSWMINEFINKYSSFCWVFLPWMLQ